MRLPNLLVCGSLVLLGGCVTQMTTPAESHSIHDLIDTQKRRIRDDLLVGLNVSDALFSTVRAAVSSSGTMTVCGWVRVRSDFPDYPRYPDNRPFVVTYTYDGGQIRNFRLVHFANSKAEVPPLYVRCSALGIPL